MFIYKFHSSLFIGQERILVMNWPVKQYILESFVNLDNAYDEDKKWKLVEATS